MFSFRGVVFDVDPQFANTQEWYESIPEHVRPSKDQPFYHVLGAPANSYVSTVPAVADVDAVAWGLASLPSGASLQGEFSMTTNANAAGTIKGIASGRPAVRIFPVGR